MAYELKIKTHNNNIVGYWPSSNQGSKCCIILAPGFPHYFDKYHPFVNQVINKEIDLFITRYIGSWENKGSFTIQNSINSIQDIIDLINSGSGISLFDNQIINFNYQSIYLVGFSFGALPVLFTQYNSGIKKVLICPFLHHSFHMKGGSGENILESFQFVKEGYGNLYNYKLDSIIKEIKTLSYDSSDQQSKYNLIIGEYDKSIPIGEINWFKENYIVTNTIISPGGHSIVIGENILDLLIHNE